MVSLLQRLCVELAGHGEGAGGEALGGSTMTTNTLGRQGGLRSVLSAEGSLGICVCAPRSTNSPTTIPQQRNHSRTVV